MQPRSAHLRLVPAPREPRAREDAVDREGVAIVVVLLIVNSIPMVCELAGLGHWGPGTVGLATACALLAARELWVELRPVVHRARR
jgi:hypothetical protein